MIVSRARDYNIPDVLALLNGAAERLHARGIMQWPNEPHFTPDRIEPLVAAGDVYLAWDYHPVATITIQAGGDPDFWTPAELAEPASYLSKMARAEGARGWGAALLRWAVDAADKRRDRWVRLDAWKANTGLHRYYTDRGWDYLRTVEAPGRNSGALFQRLALPCKHPFTWAPALLTREVLSRPLGIIPVGAEVVTQDWGSGVVAEVITPDVTQQVVTSGWEYEIGRPAISYKVKLGDGREVIAVEGDITEAATVETAAHV